MDEFIINEVAEMKDISWIHLSSIHYNSTLFFDELICERLKTYIKGLNCKFDFLVLTGDVAYKNQSIKENKINFINKIASDYLDDANNVFIVPGQHDLERSDMRGFQLGGIYSNTEFIRMSLENNSKEYKELISAFKGNNRKIGFNEFYKKVKNTPFIDKELYFIEERNDFNIVNINTCFYSGKNSEEGSLIIDQERLRRALNSLVNSNKFNIAIGHHSIDCLSKSQGVAFVSNLLEYNIDLYLCGHMNKSLNLSSLASETDLLSICCNLRDDENRLTPRFITGKIKSDTGRGDIAFHSWSNKYQRFNIDTEAEKNAPSGVLPIILNRLKERNNINESIIIKDETVCDGYDIEKIRREYYPECIVKVKTQNAYGEKIDAGTGFFVAPGVVLTCIHLFSKKFETCFEKDLEDVINDIYKTKVFITGDTKEPDIECSIDKLVYKKEEKRFEAAFLKINDESFIKKHPVAVIDGDRMLRKKGYFIQGFTSAYEGDSTTLSFDGETALKENVFLLKFNEGQVEKGYSGSPILNPFSGCVCGFIKTTRNEDTSLGGRGMPIKLLMDDINTYRNGIARVNPRWEAEIAKAYHNN